MCSLLPTTNIAASARSSPPPLSRSRLPSRTPSAPSLWSKRPSRSARPPSSAPRVRPRPPRPSPPPSPRPVTPLSSSARSRLRARLVSLSWGFCVPEENSLQLLTLFLFLFLSRLALAVPERLVRARLGRQPPSPDSSRKVGLGVETCHQQKQCMNIPILSLVVGCGGRSGQWVQRQSVPGI